MTTNTKNKTDDHSVNIPVALPVSVSISIADPSLGKFHHNWSINNVHNRILYQVKAAPRVSPESIVIFVSTPA